MNAIRGVMTVFLAALVTAAALGWRWVGALPPAKTEAARIVLAVAALAACGAILLIWSAKPRNA